MTKHPFNMVEIALALAVIAIGMASIMVLFPAGLKAGGSARAEAYLADILETVTGQIRATMMETAKENGWNGAGNYTGNSSLMLDSWSETELAEKDMLLEKSGTFLFRQFRNTPDGGDYVDLSAIIAVKRVYGTAGASISPEVLAADIAAGGNFERFKSYNVTNEATDELNKMLAIFDVEVSWPAEAAHDNREIHKYRIEIFNEKYNQALVSP